MRADLSRVLIVEDEYFIADDLATGFGAAGIAVVGPVSTVVNALAAADLQPLEGAVLDINLDGDKVYDVADMLIARGIPLVFVTGYDRWNIPDRFGHVPFCQKPVEVEKVIACLRAAAGG